MLIEFSSLEHRKTIASRNIKIFKSSLFLKSPLPFRNRKMLSAKKLINLARKWQKLAAVRRKRISFLRTNEDVDADQCSTSTMVEKGHFVVYSADRRRYVLPLEYLENDIVRELFELAEEEFGLPGDGPLMLPCEAAFMEYVISLIQRQAAKDVQRAVLMSMTRNCCSSSWNLLQKETSQQLPICSF